MRMYELDHEFLSKAHVKGVGLLELGVTNVSKWSRAMLYHFGEPIRPHLDQLWISAQDELQKRQAATPTNLLAALPMENEQKLPNPSAASDSPDEGRANYFTRHWRGDLSLGISYWVNGILAYALVALLAEFVVALRETVGIKTTAAACILLYAFALVVSVWQIVGIWRSASKHVGRGGLSAWAVLAKVMAVIGVLKLISFTTTAAPQTLELAQVVLGVTAPKQATATNQSPPRPPIVTEESDAEAQYELAMRYHSGDGVPKDYAEAVKWCSKAAEQGYAVAQNGLGLCYVNGQGVSQDSAEGAKWFRIAAEQGLADAQNNLGQCYYYGAGVAKDSAEAAKWFRMAAEQGLADAQFRFGICLSLGDGVPKDTAEGVKLQMKAAGAGFAGAQFLIGIHHYNDKPPNYVEAAKWYEKAAEQGFASSQVELAKMCATGKGIPKDQRTAANWWRRAAEQGNENGQYFIGNCYWRGDGVPQDFIEAYKWLNLAAAPGDTPQSRSARDGRDLLLQEITPQQVKEGQRRASAFVAKTEGGGTDSDGILRKPELSEETMSAGTGFFVTDDGYLVTCEHVVRGATSLHVRLSGRSIPAKLVKKDRTVDLALLKVNGTFQALPVSREPRIKLGAGVFTIGFPNPDVQGVEPKLTRGEISSLAGIRDNPRCFQISVPVQPGNSGGALVDESGNVVGVVTAKLDDVATYKSSGSFPQNVNYAIKGNLVRAFLDTVPELAGKLKAPRTAKDREAASVAAERAAVLVITE